MTRTTSVSGLRGDANSSRALRPQLSSAIIAEAKDRIPHGFFGAWCTDAVGIDRRSALNYAHLAKIAKTHGRERIEKLSVTAAHYIAAPSTPTAVVEVVLDRVAAGNIPTAAEVRDLIRETREVGAERGTDQMPEKEVEVLSHLLAEALDEASLSRLRGFLSRASVPAIREFCRNLEASLIQSAAQKKLVNEWRLTS